MRQILHHGPTPEGTPVILDDRAISGCWFELHRQGGCGAGEVVLQREFSERRAIEIGDWISCEAIPGERIYLGRVEECRYQLPGKLVLRLMGMSIELNEVFPGGFDATSSGQRPHRYGATDLFSNDPDRSWELAFPATTLQGLVQLLITHHVQNRTHIQYVPSLIEAPVISLAALSVKFRGEESVRSILKDLGLRAQANWGVDAQGRFFFIQRRKQLHSALRLDRDLTACEERRDRELLFNRLLLTGDYVYDKRDRSGQIARRVYRWRANYFEPDSVQRYGNRRLRLWVPWIRTQADSLNFAREFFRLYSVPAARFTVETVPGCPLVIPWEGEVSLLDSDGDTVGRGLVDKVRIQFDHAPRMRLEIGPEDPREQWPEPPQDERWELPDHIPSNGGHVSVTGQLSGGGGGGGGDSQPSSSQSWSDPSSDLSSSDLSSTEHSSSVATSVNSSDQSDSPSLSGSGATLSSGHPTSDFSLGTTDQASTTSDAETQPSSFSVGTTSTGLVTSSNSWPTSHTSQSGVSSELSSSHGGTSRHVGPSSSEGATSALSGSTSELQSSSGTHPGTSGSGHSPSTTPVSSLSGDFSGSGELSSSHQFTDFSNSQSSRTGSWPGTTNHSWPLSGNSQLSHGFSHPLSHFNSSGLPHSHSGSAAGNSSSDHSGT